MVVGAQRRCRRILISVMGVRADALLVVAVLSVSHGTLPWPLTVALGLLLTFGLAAAGMPKGMTQKMASWIPIALLTSVYVAIAEGGALTSAMVALVRSRPLDAWALAADRFLFMGTTPAQWFDTAFWMSPWMLRVGLFVYGPVYVYAHLVTYGVILLRGTRRDFLEARAMMVLVYLAGYLIYGILPVTGPTRAEGTLIPHLFSFHPAAIALTTEFEGFKFYAFDCFPSLHTAGTLLMATLLSPRLPRWAKPAPWCVLAAVLWVTLMLRAHYFIDLVGGAALCGVVVWTVRRTRFGDARPLAWALRAFRGACGRRRVMPTGR
jgi:membrane-associated phospholipid phosphatase